MHIIAVASGPVAGDLRQPASTDREDAQQAIVNKTAYSPSSPFSLAPDATEEARLQHICNLKAQALNRETKRLSSWQQLVAFATAVEINERAKLEYLLSC